MTTAAYDPEALSTLAEHAARDHGWPQACLDSERSYGHCAARLYPLLGKKVWTPQGIGKLWQAFSARAGVILDGQKIENARTLRVTFFDPRTIRPLDTVEREGGDE
jgi:hypothetical protein